MMTSETFISYFTELQSYGLQNGQKYLPTGQTDNMKLPPKETVMATINYSLTFF